MNNNIIFVKLDEDAIIPTKSDPNSAGYDLYINHDLFFSNERTIYNCPTGIAVILPELTSEIKCYGRIAPRSGLALKGFDVGAGVIDNNYRGEIKVIIYTNPMYNLTGIVKKGSRIAQLIPTLYLDTIPKEITKEEFMQLQQTERGERGFGSTGI